MNERRTLNWFVYLLVISIIGACNVRPANTTTTTFVVWPEEILATVGIVPRVTAGDLVLQEGVPTMSASEIAAFEANPSQPLLPATTSVVIAEWKRKFVASALEVMKGQWGDPNAPTSTRSKPKSRPAPPKY